MIYDLSITLNEDTLPFPDSSDPHMTWKTLVDHSFYKSQVSLFSMVTHFGTHIDTPLHYIKDGKTTAQIDLDKYCGQAVCLAVPDFPDSGVFDITDTIEKYRSLITPGDIILLSTGWELRLGSPDYFSFADFHENTGAILQSLGAKGIGFDLPAIDRNDKAHLSVLGRDMSIIESLVNLIPLVGRRFYFSAVPLKFEHGDGSPVRAYAVIDE